MDVIGYLLINLVYMKFVVLLFIIFILILLLLKVVGLVVEFRELVSVR